MRERPLGVSIVAFFMLALGILSFASGVSLLATKNIAFEMFMKEYGYVINQTFNVDVAINEELLSTLYDFVAYAAIVFGVLYTVTGWGLLNMHNWGRVAAVILCGFNIVYGLFVVFADPLIIAEIAVNAVVIWYLMRSDIREKFERRRSIEERILGEGFD